jgi:hypothetical protein
MEVLMDKYQQHYKYDRPTIPQVRLNLMHSRHRELHEKIQQWKDLTGKPVTHLVIDAVEEFLLKTNSL